jgi:universal stress protein E
MAGFKNILLVVNSNALCKEACERAITLAAEENARLTILNLIEVVPERLDSPADQSSMDLRDIGILDRCEKLKELIPKQANLQSKINVVCGSPVTEVMQQVLRGRHDLVMVAEHSMPSSKPTSLGSTTLKLIRKCACPVWVISPSIAKGDIRVMAAVDPDPFDTARDALNTKILNIASSLAGREGTQLHIVNAWRAFAEGVLRSQGGLSAENLSRYVYNVFNVQASSVKQTVQNSSATTVRHRMHLMKGTASKVIPIAVRRERIDLLVVGMFSRRGLGGWLIGNTAEKILNQVKCSVLMVKPNGAVAWAGKPSHSDGDKIARIDGSSTDKEKVFPEIDTVRKRGTYNE